MAAFAVLLNVASVVSGVLAVKASRAEALANTRFEGEKKAREEEEKQRKLAEASAARSEKILAIVGDSFDALNPDTGATADMSAKDVLLKAKESLDSSDLDDLGKIHLLGQLYHSFSGLSQYDEAVEVTEEWRDLSTATLGPDHPDTLSAMSNLANGYRSAGRTKEAIDLEERTLQLKKTELGPEDPGTLYSMANLAASYFEAGRTEEAIQLAEQTLQLRKTKLGSDHPDTLETMGNLATSYYSAGQIHEAIKLIEQTVQLKKAKLGSDHPETLYSMGDLAVCYTAAGRTDEAVELDEQTVQQAKFGPDHPETLNAMNFLAASYDAAGQIAESIKLGGTNTPAKKNQPRAGPLGYAYLDGQLGGFLRSRRIGSEVRRASPAKVVSRLNGVIGDLRKRHESTPSAKVLRILALGEYRSGNYEAAISAAESSIKTSSEPAHPMNLALLSMSNFNLGDVERANDFREQFVEAMKSAEYKDDKDCLLFADEVKELFASKSAATESGPED